jgi:hypothetical protein
MALRVEWLASLDPTGRVLSGPAVPVCFPRVAVYYGEALVPSLAAIAVTLPAGGGFRRLP